MALKVPEQQSRVEKETPIIQTPTQPTLTSPRVVSAAFGVDTARATQQLGDVGTQIAEHLVELEIDKQNKEALERLTEAKKEGQGWLRDQEEETYKDSNGKDITRPKGYLLQQLDHSEGATNRLTEKYEGEARARFLSGMSERQADILAPKLDSYFLGLQNKVITHESNQRDESFKNSTDSGLDQSYLDASTIRNPVELDQAIDNAISEAQPYYSRFDENTQKVKNNDIAANVIKSATSSLLQDTGSLEEATALLDSAKDTIAQATYNEIKKVLTNGSNSINTATKQAELQNRVATRFGSIGGVADGVFDWSNSSELIRTIARTDSRLAEAMENNIKNGKPTIKDADNKSFMKIATDMFEAGTPEEVTEFLTTALNDTKNISRERLSILVYAGKQRAKEIEKGEGSGFWNGLSKLVGGDFEVLVNTITRAKGENATNEQLGKIVVEETSKQRKRENPEIHLIAEKGEIQIDAQGNKARVFPDGTYEEIQ